MLPNEEILDLYYLKNDNVISAITENINYWNQINSTNYTITDINNNYKLLSREGELEVFYTIKNSLKSYSTTVFVQ